MFKHPILLIASAGLAASACSNDSGDPYTTQPDDVGGVQIVVQPWELDSVAGVACYDIEVTTADGDLVWHENHACSDDFGLGDDGSLTYVGICDAGGGLNHVVIKLESLVDDEGVSMGNWTSPPTFTTDILCVANADVLVTANFLVLTQGDIGFLDVKITTEEVACNAKVDCRSDFLGTEGDADPNAPGVQHDGTIIIGLACNAEGDGFTPLYLDDVVLTCKDRNSQSVSVTIHPGAKGSQIGLPNEFVFGAIGNSGVAGDGTSYWTLQIGVRSGWTDCHLSTRMAASDGRDLDVNNLFPVIVADAVDFGFDAAGVFSCASNPLDGEHCRLHSTWASSDDVDFDGCLMVDANGNPTVRICGEL